MQNFYNKYVELTDSLYSKSSLNKEDAKWQMKDVFIDALKIFQKTSQTAYLVTLLFEKKNIKKYALYTLHGQWWSVSCDFRRLVKNPKWYMTHYPELSWNMC